MKEQNSRETLLNKIEEYFDNLSPYMSKKLEEEIQHDGKFTSGEFMKMVTGRCEFSELSDAQLYWLTLDISKASKRFDKPSEYFTSAEIGNYKYYDPSEENVEFNNGITFTEVSQLAENQWMFPLSVREIKNLKNANKLQIIPELQRNSTKDKYGDLKTKVNKNTAREISTLIDNGEFFFNAVRFNLMDDGEADYPIYDSENHTLTITNGTMIVPDGNHRTIACELTNNHLDDRFCVLFSYLTAPQTRLLLNQEWTTVPIPKRHKDAMKPTIANKIVDAIMRSHDVDDIIVKGIVKDGSEIRSGHGFILYIELAEAIQRYYDTNNMALKADQDELRDWIISFMNQLTKIMYNDFNNYNNVKKTKWNVHYMAWHYYIMLSKVLYHDLEWRQKLEDIIRNTDFESETIRGYCVSNNRRAFYEFVNSEEVKYNV